MGDTDGGYRLADFGSFFIPGRRVALHGVPAKMVHVSPDLPALAYGMDGSYEVEQAYVQYFVPARRRHAAPVVLLHGGSLTGAMWETTPDGRPGWLHRLIGLGFAVYVLDNVERGRAGWCALPGEWPGEPLPRSAEQCWWFFRIGRRQDFARRRQAPGQQFPGTAFDALVRQLVPRWLTTTEAKTAALLRLMERVGPCHLIGFSEGGEVAQAAVARQPELVRSAIFLEPVSFPEALPAAARPGLRVLYVGGDGFALNTLFAEADAKAVARAAALTAGGAEARRLLLPEAGLAGNTHMMMMDRTSDEVLARLVDWMVAG